MAIDLNVVGQTRGVQDPRKLQEAREGRHRDDVDRVDVRARYPNSEKAAPDPSPFVRR